MYCLNQQILISNQLTWVLIYIAAQGRFPLVSQSRTRFSSSLQPRQSSTCVRSTPFSASVCFACFRSQQPPSSSFCFSQKEICKRGKNQICSAYSKVICRVFIETRQLLRAISGIWSRCWRKAREILAPRAIFMTGTKPLHM